ncbi:MAG: hypothetical protein COY72_00215 [Candidatus Nealsonbacteria bacterium CG_4_10_14_0_8_um_filter_35_10]|uniref:Uncharacterized protein n=2 Tax=Candidatus Nealsoniibacteriota TaxID=1817911 RepID=A0A2M7R8X8_9BACT|nr:MAG: hypothetical protein COY72_00215 [Candidatus Nealsonbacteria bacterium CG_4_10_14_0_8_um_filter_35_10]PJB99587.1 MAG: hypothetical protein CO077_00910 [Candidatus Nealsonbacteria bacterium CG_4_9_14_0_8_um_filter_35_12]
MAFGEIDRKNIDLCLLKGGCYFKRKETTKGKFKIEYRRCTFSGTCNQKKRLTLRQLVSDFSKNQNVLSRILKRAR